MKIRNIEKYCEMKKKNTFIMMVIYKLKNIVIHIYCAKLNIES